MKRKNWIVPAAVLSLAVLACRPAKAGLIAYDGFDYTIGTDNLAGNNGGTGWVTPGSGSAANSAWTADDNNTPSVVSGSLSYTGLQASAGNSIQGYTNSGPVTQAGRSFSATSITSGTIYISELVNLAPVAAENRVPYAANFIRLGTGSGQYNSNWNADFGFNGNYDYGDPEQNLFINSSFISSSPDYQSSVAVDTSSTQLLVAQINLDTGLINLYLDPTVGAPLPAVASLSGTETGLVSGGGISVLDVVGDDNNAGDPAIVDEIRVGTTFASVTPGVAAVPEPASLGLLGIAVIGLLGKRCRR